MEEVEKLGMVVILSHPDPGYCKRSLYHNFFLQTLKTYALLIDDCGVCIFYAFLNTIRKLSII